MKSDFSHISDELFKDKDRIRSGGFFNNQPIPDEAPIYHADKPKDAGGKELPQQTNDRAFPLLQDAAKILKALSAIYLELSDIFNLEEDRDGCLLFLKKASGITDEQHFLVEFIDANLGRDCHIDN